MRKVLLGGLVTLAEMLAQAPNFEKSFSVVTGVTILGSEHKIGHAKIFVECYDSSSPRKSIEPNTVTIDAATFDVIITFFVAQTGTCILAGQGGGPAGITSTSVVTVNANTTAEQNLTSLTIPAEALDSAGRFTQVWGAGVYSIGSQTPTLTFRVKLCTVSGCGSGTVITLAQWATTATTKSATNMPWKIVLWIGTVTTGASGTVEAHGVSIVTLGTVPGANSPVYNDTVSAPSPGINLTAQLFLQFTVATSTSSSSNAISQRHAAMHFVN